MKLRNAKGKRRLSQVDPARTQAGDAGTTEPKPEKTGSSATAQVADVTAKLMAADVELSEFDAAKVARIAQAIADGTFNVNAEAIADKLIAELHEMLGKASPTK